MKNLTQKTLRGQPSWVKSAAVDGNGRLWGYDCDLTRLYAESGYWSSYGKDIIFCELGEGYDSTNWQRSAINRA